MKSLGIGGLWWGDRGTVAKKVRNLQFSRRIASTDHRIGLTLHRLNTILEGELDQIIDALTTLGPGGSTEKIRRSLNSGRFMKCPKASSGGRFSLRHLMTHSG